ncbi:MAG: hypothetical protein U9N03_03840, partial [Candidatus Caldatribacteriota bacterium]|nr:hypothetical protein [Candidatus Caldatribacteriota bacterium]
MIINRKRVNWLFEAFHIFFANDYLNWSIGKSKQRWFYIMATKKESTYVKLARETIENYIKSGQIIAPP